MNKELIDYYNFKIKQGYRQSVIAERIAENCHVSIHLVRKWLSGTEVRQIYNDSIIRLIESDK